MITTAATFCFSKQWLYISKILFKKPKLPDNKSRNKSDFIYLFIWQHRSWREEAATVRLVFHQILESSRQNILDKWSVAEILIFYLASRGVYERKPLIVLTSDQPGKLNARIIDPFTSLKYRILRGPSCDLVNNPITKIRIERTSSSTIFPLCPQISTSWAEMSL